MHELGIRFLINAYDQYSLQWTVHVCMNGTEHVWVIAICRSHNLKACRKCFNMFQWLGHCERWSSVWWVSYQQWQFLDCISGGKLPAKHGISQTAWLVDPTCTCADVLLSIVLVSLSAREGFCVCLLVFAQDTVDLTTMCVFFLWYDTVGWKRLECCVSLCIRLHWHVHIILYMGRYVDGLHW